MDTILIAILMGGLLAFIASLAGKKVLTVAFAIVIASSYITYISLFFNFI